MAICHEWDTVERLPDFYTIHYFKKGVKVFFTVGSATIFLWNMEYICVILFVVSGICRSNTFVTNGCFTVMFHGKNQKLMKKVKETGVMLNHCQNRRPDAFIYAGLRGIL